MSSAWTSRSTTNRGRREFRKHVTQHELLASGRRLFGEKGLYESSIEDLSKRAGIAKGTLYGYFANKDDLIEAVVSAGFDELLGHVARRTRGARSRTESVTRAVDAHLEFFEENPDLMRIFHQVRGRLKFEVAAGSPLRGLLLNYLEDLARLLERTRPSSHGQRRPSFETAGTLFGAASDVSSTRAALAGFLPKDLRSGATIAGLVALVLEYERGIGKRAVVARRPHGAGDAANAEHARGRARIASARDRRVRGAGSRPGRARAARSAAGHKRGSA